jgi:MFS transporter, DHA1 family, multidrug resistance protein
MLGAFSTDTYLPSFPSIAAEFQISLDIVQQTLTVYLLTMAVMTLFHGTLSDAVGRRPVILGGLAVYLAASIGAFFAGNFFHSCFSAA